MSPQQISLRLPNRRLRQRSLVSLTPLIDVVFILLIFLMLVSNFLDRGALDVSVDAPGVSSTVEDSTPPIRLLLIDADTATLDGREIPVPGLRDALLATAGNRKDPVLLIRSGQDVTLQTVVSVLSVARQIPGLKLSLAESGVTE